MICSIDFKAKGMYNRFIRKAYCKEGVLFYEGGERMDCKEQLLELRKSTGMNRREFTEYFGIPYRTLQDWELGNRQMPEYLLRLMAYKVGMEQMTKESELQKGEQ